MKQAVVIVSGDNGNPVATVENEGKLGQTVWSPDGKRIALRGAKDLNDPIDGRILIVSAEGGKPEKIDAGYHGKYERIDWTSANTIHYLASEGTDVLLGTIQPDGSGKKEIFRTDAHRITAFSRAKNGAISSPPTLLTTPPSCLPSPLREMPSL